MMRRAITASRLSRLIARLLFSLLAAGSAVVSVAAQDVGELARQAASGSVEEKREALRILRNLKTEEASRAAAPALRDSDEIVRATAAFSVLFLGPTEAFRTLLPNLSDKSEIVRRETAYAVGLAGDPVAIEMLVEMAGRDKSVEVRNAAIIALGSLGNAGAVPALTKMLGERPKEESEFRRRSAARAIGQIALNIQTGGRRVVTPQSFLPDGLKDLKPEARRNLAAGDPVFRAAFEALLKVLRNPKEADDTRREAAFALGEIGDPAAAPILQAGLGSKDVYLAEIAREALLKIRQTR